ncbi:hypothetical protein XELAEV_18045807mg [Xenopus laevis]|uniref:CCHC-type domain-containing protein n=1 Tax=Xenopus laevis TaxID=8355 RepID=A0A974C2H6_XENLA|nr:hypothetical protein XELAEV_18045807mg [Xenopus laevis]
MEFVERYVNKYASGDYHSCADESLTHQFKSLLTQCQSYNNKVKSLLKMKVIAENKAEQWRNEKAQFREDLEKFGESLIVAASTSEEHISELEELREKVELLAKQNDLLEEKLKDYACALLRARLPYQLAAELRPLVGKHIGTLSNINENWGGTTERLRELQRILGGHDTKVVFSCPDMLPDEPNFLYSTANKCNVDYNTRTALRYATSHTNFINTLRDWSQESFEFQRHISVPSKNHQSRRFPQKCYSCGKYGHIARFCRTSANQRDTYPIHSIQRQEGDVQENLNDYLLDHSPPPEPETVVSSDNINTGKEGTTATPFMPWVNIPLWLYSSWSHIAMQMLMGNF